MKDKYQTEYDVAKYYFFLGLIIGIPFCVFFIIDTLIVSANAKNTPSIIVGYFILFITILPFVVSEVIFFFMWFPYERKKKKALAFGQEYDAKIININRRSKGKLRIIVKSSYYTLDVQYKKGRRKYNFTTDVYIYSPKDYIPKNRQCKVYEYEDKMYIQDFYYHKTNDDKELEEFYNKPLSACELREYYVSYEDLFEFSNEEIPYLNEEEFNLALQEREEYPPKKSHWHILTPAILVVQALEQAYVFVELRITSVNAMSYEDLNIYKSLCEYVRQNAGKYFEGNTAGYIYDIKKYVIESCKITVPQLKVDEVLVAIRDAK